MQDSHVPGQVLLEPAWMACEANGSVFGGGGLVRELLNEEPQVFSLVSEKDELLNVPLPMLRKDE